MHLPALTKLLITVLFAGSYAGALHAQSDDPATLAPLSFSGTGGDSVTGGGRWALIANDEVTPAFNCPVQFYRLDYDTMDWVLSDTVGSILSSTCADGEYGASTSLAGDVVVLGSPGYNNQGGCTSGGFLGLFPDNIPNRGGIAVYRLENENPNLTSDWVRQDDRNCSNDVIQYATDGGRDDQAGARFGESVSITQVGADDYRIVVGAPGYNGGAGKIYVYSYSGNTLNLLDTVTGAAGQALGNAVTISSGFADGATRLLAGVPGAAGGQGEGRVYRLAGASLTLDQTLTVAGAVALGQEVTIADAQLLVSATNGAYVFRGDGPNNASKYSFAQAITGNAGGDVSQSAGVASIGGNAPGAQGATSLRDAVADPVSTAVVADVSADFGDSPDIGIDIRLTREFLWFADAARDQALVYRYPAGFGARMETPFQYELRSLPCDVAGLTVGQVFGYLGTAAADDPANATYDIYRYDPAAPTDPTPYLQLGAADVFPAAVDGQNHAVWLAVATPQYVSLNACNGFTTPESLAPQDGGSSFTTAVVRQKLLPLPDAQFSVPDGETFARVMLNNPFPRSVKVADIRYVDGAGTVKTLPAAAAASELDDVLYVYDPVNPNIPSGQNYRALTATATPPFGDSLAGHEGAWLFVRENGLNGGPATHELLMPQPE